MFYDQSVEPVSHTHTQQYQDNADISEDVIIVNGITIITICNPTANKRRDS